MSWGGIFGSGAGLITLFICFMIAVPFEVMIGRLVVASLMGSMAGVVVGWVIGAIATMKPKKGEADDKGGRVDFTVGEEQQALRAGGAITMAPDLLTTSGEVEAFQPLDLRSAAALIQPGLPD